MFQRQLKSAIFRKEQFYFYELQHKALIQGNFLHLRIQLKALTSVLKALNCLADSSFSLSPSTAYLLLRLTHSLCSSHRGFLAISNLTNSFLPWGVHPCCSFFLNVLPPELHTVHSFPLFKSWLKHPQLREQSPSAAMWGSCIPAYLVLPTLANNARMNPQTQGNLIM